MAQRISICDHNAINSLLSTALNHVPDAAAVLQGNTIRDDWFMPRFNVSPLSAVWALHIDTVRYRLTPAQWGLIPPWAKPGQFERPLTHARAETIYEKASFKNLIRRYRAVVLVNGFYIYKTSDANKTHYISNKEFGALALGAVWQFNVDGNVELAIINQVPVNIKSDNQNSGNQNSTQSYKSLGERFPVVIAPEQIAQWLEDDSANNIEACFNASQFLNLSVTEVSAFVRNPQNEGPECVAPEKSR